MSPMWMLPAWMGYIPCNNDSSEVFTEPLSPTTAVISPLRNSNCRLLKRGRPGQYRKWTVSTEIYPIISRVRPACCGLNDWKREVRGQRVSVHVLHRLLR